MENVWLLNIHMAVMNLTQTVFVCVSWSGAPQRNAVSHRVRSERGAHPRPPLAPESRGARAGQHPQAAAGRQGGSVTLLRRHLSVHYRQCSDDTVHFK